MLINDIPLANGADNRVYKLVDVTSTGAVRQVEGSPLAEPKLLITFNEKKGKGNSRYVRFGARLETAQPVQTDGGTPVVSAHIVFNVPLNNDSATIAEDLRVRLLAFATSANLTSMLGGAK